MNSLKTVGLNTVYVEAWKNGYTNFTSPTLATFTGRSSLNPSLSGRTLLNETRTAAANAGLVHGAWFEYGLMAEFGSPSNPLAVKCRDATWTVGTTSGTGWLGGRLHQLLQQLRVDESARARGAKPDQGHRR